LIAPGSVVVTPGFLSATFQFRAIPPATGWALLSATLGTVTKSAAITIAAATTDTPHTELALRCDPRQITGGGTAVCEIAQNPDDATDDAELTITSSSQNVQTPAMVHGRTGRGILRFEVISDETAPQEKVTIAVHSPTGSASENLLVVSTGSIHVRAPKTLTVTPDTPVRFTVEAGDDQGLPVSMVSANPPKGAKFDPASGLFEWLPTTQDLGSTEVAFTATNSLSFSETKVVSIKVVASRPFLAGLRNGAGPGALAACTPGALATLIGTSLTGARDMARVLVNGSIGSIVRASSEQIDFLCPEAAPGTPLTFSVQAGENLASNELQTSMAKTAPGLLSLDGSGGGLGMALHDRGLAALPRFDRIGTPAMAGDVITLFATGINCDGNAGDSKPVVYFENTLQQVRSLQRSSFAGVCEVSVVTPRGLASGEVRVTLEAINENGTPLRSNQVLIAIEN
jgi:uncharacterized protein (TIGR03437 family)